MPFDQDAFRRQFDECCNVAEGIRQPRTVRAQVRVQAGREILVGRCPVEGCGQVAAIDGEGKHLCRRCWAWLRYVRER